MDRFLDKLLYFLTVCLSVIIGIPVFLIALFVIILTVNEFIK